MMVDLDECLRQLGLAPNDVNALFFVPAAVVAWADGEAEIKELEAIAAKHRRDCDEGNCLCLSESARQFVYYHFAYQRPKPELMRVALRCLSLYLLAQTQEKADRLRELVLAVAVDVARSARTGLLSGRGVDLAEKLALANMAGALGFHDIPALLERLEKGA